MTFVFVMILMATVAPGDQIVWFVVTVLIHLGVGVHFGLLRVLAPLYTFYPTGMSSNIARP
jgi:hypothetical protein